MIVRCLLIASSVFVLSGCAPTKTSLKGVSQTETLDDGTLHGTSTTWHDKAMDADADGRAPRYAKREQGDYWFGAKHGEWQLWDRNGRLVERQEWHFGDQLGAFPATKVTGDEPARRAPSNDETPTTPPTPDPSPVEPITEN